jgi:hypothetical protein
MVISPKSQHTAYSATVSYKFDMNGTTKKNKTAKARDHHLSCTAYVNGISSSVPLLMDSRKKKVLEWDLVAADPSKSAKYHDEKLEDDEQFMMSFSQLIGEDPTLKDRIEEGGHSSSDDEDYTCTQQQALAYHVEPITMVQLCSAWFLCRSLSITSSCSDKLISTAAKYIDPNHNMRGHFRNVLDYTGQLSLLPGREVESNDDSDGDEEETAAGSDDEEETAPASAAPAVGNDDEKETAPAHGYDDTEETAAAAAAPAIGNVEEGDKSERFNDLGGKKRIVMLAEGATVSQVVVVAVTMKAKKIKLLLWKISSIHSDLVMDSTILITLIYNSRQLRRYPIKAMSFLVSVSMLLELPRTGKRIRLKQRKSCCIG